MLDIKFHIIVKTLFSSFTLEKFGGFTNDPIQLAWVFNEIKMEKQAEAYKHILEEIDWAAILRKNPEAKIPAPNEAELRKRTMNDLWTGLINFF